MSTNRPNARVRLTKTIVEKFDAPERGQHFLRDTELKGFAVRATANGTKSFILEKRIEGRVRRMTLGRVGELTVGQARTRAQQLLGKIAFGEDPAARRQQERARQITLADVYRDYIAARPTMSPSTRRDYERAMRAVFKDWAHRPLHRISRDMVVRRHRHLGETRGEYAANNYMRVLRALYGYAINRYDDAYGEPIISRNPVLVLTRTKAWFREDRRQTIVKVHELPAWYRGVESLREADHKDSMGDTVADLLILLLFTGLRRSEATHLTWRDIDLKERSLTITKTKSHRRHTLPIGPFLHSFFVRRFGARRNRFVFPGRDGEGHIVEPKRQIAHVVAESGIPFTPHDLRRTFLTIADAINLSAYTIKRLANHSTRGDVTAGYIISDLERLRTPMVKIEEYLLSAIGLSSDGQVIPFPDRTP